MAGWESPGLPRDSQLQEEKNVLETWLLDNSATSETIFERIFAKYSREYEEEESGGELIDFSNEAAFEEQIQKLNWGTLKVKENEVTSSCSSSNSSSCSSSNSSSCSSSSDEGGLFPSRTGSKVLRTRHERAVRRPDIAYGNGSDKDTALSADPTLTAKLHEKVLKIKKELNWDEKERLARQKLTGNQDLSSEDDEGGIWSPAEQKGPAERKAEGRVWSPAERKAEGRVWSPAERKAEGRVWSPAERKTEGRVWSPAERKTEGRVWSPAERKAEGRVWSPAERKAEGRVWSPAERKTEGRVWSPAERKTECRVWYQEDSSESEGSHAEQNEPESGVECRIAEESCGELESGVEYPPNEQFPVGLVLHCSSVCQQSMKYPSGVVVHSSSSVQETVHNTVELPVEGTWLSGFESSSEYCPVNRRKRSRHQPKRKKYRMSGQMPLRSPSVPHASHVPLRSSPHTPASRVPLRSSPHTPASRVPLRSSPHTPASRVPLRSSPHTPASRVPLRSSPAPQVPSPHTLTSYVPLRSSPHAPTSCVLLRSSHKHSPASHKQHIPPCYRHSHHTPITTQAFLLSEEEYCHHYY